MAAFGARAPISLRVRPLRAGRARCLPAARRNEDVRRRGVAPVAGFARAIAHTPFEANHLETSCVTVEPQWLLREPRGGPQPRVLWALDERTCESLLDSLVHDGFLIHARDGSYVRAEVY